MNDSFPENHLESRFLFRRDHPDHSPAIRAAIDSFMENFDPEFVPPLGRFSEWHFMVVEPAESHDDVYYFDRPVLVLMNEDCFSATDIFLGALKEIDHVTLLGTSSGGGSGRTQSVRLPASGVEVRLSSMASFRPNGQLYDGRGIAPHIELTPGPEFFIGESDKALDTAIDLIRERTQ